MEGWKEEKNLIAREYDILKATLSTVHENQQSFCYERQQKDKCYKCVTGNLTT